MRWFLIDRFTEFVSGKHACSIRSISLSEEAIDGYSPGFPRYPTSLIIEGMAQTGGILVGQLSDFKDRVVLAKVLGVKTHFEAVPGDILTLRADLQSHGDAGSFIEGTVHRGDDLMAEISLMFAMLIDDRFSHVQLFEPADFCRMLRVLKLFDVGVNSDGTPIHVPEYMVAAEQAEKLVDIPG